MTRTPKLDDLAAKIRELEATSLGGLSGPRGRSAVQAQGEPEATEAPALPSRDIDDDAHRPALVSLEGQAAHDASLGVLPDGTQITEEKPKRAKRPKVAQLAFSDAPPHQQALDIAYKFVSQRERTERQLRDKLAAKDCTPAAINAAVKELRRYGFVDDARYAKLFAEDKRRLQSWGERRIRMQLMRDGIARDVIDGLFADDEAALAAPSELEVALDLLARKRPDLADEKVKARMAGMLARRGIASPTVYAALREYARRIREGDA